MTEQRIAIIPDLQVPLHDQRSVDLVLEWLSDFQPDLLVNVGDDADMTQISRWVRGRKDEYVGGLQRDLDATRRVHGLFREAVGPDCEYVVKRSNHVDRFEHYLSRGAPAFTDLRVLNVPDLLGYTEHGITYADKGPYPFAPGWVVAHGDEGSLIQTAGGTAMNLAQRWGKSVVCGHTHRFGLQHKHHVVNGKIVGELFGFEVGHLMDLKRAGYLKAGYGNWQQGVGAMLVIDGHVHLHPLPIRNRRLYWEGVEYRGR